MELAAESQMEPRVEKNTQPEPQEPAQEQCVVWESEMHEPNESLQQCGVIVPVQAKSLSVAACEDRDTKSDTKLPMDSFFTLFPDEGMSYFIPVSAEPHNYKVPIWCKYCKN